MTRHDTPDAARRRFFAAALKVCSARGFTATRMADIAAEAGRSKGALYHHFANKKALFVDMVHDLVGNFRERIDEGMLGETPTRELIERAAVGLLENFGGRELFSVLVELLPLAARDPELRVPLLSYYEEGIAALAALLQWGQRRGELHAEFDPHRVARALSLSGEGIALISTSLGEQDRATEDVRELFTRVFDGLERR